MDELHAILDRVYQGRDVIGLNQIYEDMVALAAPEEAVRVVAALPEGAYREDQVIAAVNRSDTILPGDPGAGAPRLRPKEDALDVALAADDEAPAPEFGYQGPERQDPDTVRFREPSTASDVAKAPPETERTPRTAVEPRTAEPRTAEPRTAEPRTAEPRTAEPRTGAEQIWDPEDLAVAEGLDPSPANIERARRELEEEGRAAVERTVP